MKRKGSVHRMPADLRKAVRASPKAQETWDDITELAKNEWVCWVTSGRQTKA